ncbi:MAG: c-type cytochrome [Myxococcota bacterium]
MKTTTTGLILGLALLAGCSPAGGLKDPLHATGGNTMVASSDYASAYVVNTDAGTVSRVSPTEGVVGNELPVGLEPTRIARAGSKVLVTLRGERAVAVLSETPAGLVEAGKIGVGAEPYGIVTSEDGRWAYVANSMSDTVQEIEVDSLEVTRTWKVPHEPRYVTLHPSQKRLFVGSGRAAAEVTEIDLTEQVDASGEIPTGQIALPEVVRFDDEIDPATGNFRTFALTPRITGDLAIAPDGGELVIPVIYVDNVTPVEDPELTETGEPIGPVSDGYGEQTEGISRFNPGVTVVKVEPDGSPDVESAEAVFISGFRDENVDFDQIRVRSYPSSVTVSPDGTYYVVTIQGSDAVAIVGALPFEDAGRNGGGVDVGFDMAEPMPAFDEEGFGTSVFTSVRDAGFSERPKRLVWTNGAAGPDGVLFLSDESAFVHSGFDRNVSNINFRDLAKQVAEDGNAGFDRFFEEGGANARVMSISQPLTDHRLPAEVEAGRRLFFSATAPGMVATGAGVSCASCHFEGRNDGLTWTFSSGERQTPSLAGQVSATAPVTWTSQVESVAHEARITTEARMGGNGLSDAQLNNIAAFVEWTRIPDTAMHGSDDPAIARGLALFQRADVGCSSCHAGQAFTDNRHYDMLGLTQVNTPTLLGVAASAPYFHDGRAATLADVLEWSRNGQMGDTSMLSDAEMSDLEAYLRSL